MNYPAVVRCPTCLGLTTRQLEILPYYVAGWSRQQIANRFVISTRTVHSHLDGIRKATNIRNRTKLALWALRTGLVRLEAAWSLVEEVQRI